jgi:predicted nucleic acid-binding protein
VINTSPLLALIAGLNSLDILHEMYDEVIVPNEVVNEITILNSSKFGADIFNNSIFLNKQFEDIEISPFLKKIALVFLMVSIHLLEKKHTMASNIILT